MRLRVKKTEKKPQKSDAAEAATKGKAAKAKDFGENDFEVSAVKAGTAGDTQGEKNNARHDDDESDTRRQPIVPKKRLTLEELLTNAHNSARARVRRDATPPFRVLVDTVNELVYDEDDAIFFKSALEEASRAPCAVSDHPGFLSTETRMATPARNQEISSMSPAVSLPFSDTNAQMYPGARGHNPPPPRSPTSVEEHVAHFHAFSCSTQGAKKWRTVASCSSVQIGDYVVRGRDWSYGKEDAGSDGSVGKVVAIHKNSCTCRVRWMFAPDGTMLPADQRPQRTFDHYRIGAGAFDLEVVQPSGTLRVTHTSYSNVPPRLFDPPRRDRAATRVAGSAEGQTGEEEGSDNSNTSEEDEKSAKQRAANVARIARLQSRFAALEQARQKKFAQRRADAVKKQMYHNWHSIPLAAQSAKLLAATANDARQPTVPFVTRVEKHCAKRAARIRDARLAKEEKEKQELVESQPKMLESSRLLTLPGMFEEDADFLTRNERWSAERLQRAQKQKVENQLTADKYPFAPQLCTYSRQLVKKKQQDLGIQEETVDERMRRMEKEAAARHRKKNAQARRSRGETKYFKPTVSPKGKKAVPLVRPIFDRSSTEKIKPTDHSRSPSASPSPLLQASEGSVSPPALLSPPPPASLPPSPPASLSPSPPASLSPSPLADNDNAKVQHMERGKKSRRLWKKLARYLWEGVPDALSE